MTILPVVSTAILAITVVSLIKVISQFSGILQTGEEAGRQLPLSTIIVLSTYKFWWVFPLISFILGIGVLKRKSISANYPKALTCIFWGGIVLAIVLFLLTQYAMYPPIFLWAKGNA